MAACRIYAGTLGLWRMQLPIGRHVFFFFENAGDENRGGGSPTGSSLIRGPDISEAITHTQCLNT